MSLLSALCGAVFGAALLSGPAVGQTALEKAPTPPPITATIAPNPNVSIEYVPPKDAQYQGIYERLRKLRALELLQEFLSPLKLPRKLNVRIAECGGFYRSTYIPGGPVTICYEYIQEIEQKAPRANVVGLGQFRISQSGIIIGSFINLVLSETAYAILDMLQVPVWGRIEDATDYVAALVMLEFHADNLVTWATLAGTAWILAQRAFVGYGDFTNVTRSWEAQRFYNYACMAFAAKPGIFGFLVTNGNLPQDRAGNCLVDYRKTMRSFAQTIMPFVDQDRLKQVRALDWATRLYLK